MPESTDPVVKRKRKVDEDVAIVKNKIDIDASMKEATKAGKSSIGQVIDIMRLSRTTGRLQASEYYYYQLYDDSKYTFEEKTRFASERFGDSVIKACNDVDWHFKSVDKFKAYEYLEAQGFPVPESQAIFYEKDRDFGKLPRLADPSSMRDWLKNDAKFPFYAKPVFGIGSIGNFYVTKFVDDHVILMDGTSLALDEFYEQVDPSHPYLIQTVLHSHEKVTEISPRLSTVRIILYWRDGHPQVLHSLWKITAAESIADNYWRKGNMLAHVDSETGRINRVVSGTGPWLQVHQTHPVSGQSLIGWKLPFWPEIIDMCIEGAKTFSPLRFQSWDIGLAEQGPIAVEVNSGSAMSLPQLATGKGFLTDDFLDFLSNFDYKFKRLPKRSRKSRRSSREIQELQEN